MKCDTAAGSKQANISSEAVIREEENSSGSTFRKSVSEHWAGGNKLVQTFYVSVCPNLLTPIRLGFTSQEDYQDNDLQDFKKILPKIPSQIELISLISSSVYLSPKYLWKLQKFSLLNIKSGGERSCERKQLTPVFRPDLLKGNTLVIIHCKNEKKIFSKLLLRRINNSAKLDLIIAIKCHFPLVHFIFLSANAKSLTICGMQLLYFPPWLLIESNGAFLSIFISRETVRNQLSSVSMWGPRYCFPCQGHH